MTIILRAYLRHDVYNSQNIFIYQLNAAKFIVVKNWLSAIDLIEIFYNLITFQNHVSILLNMYRCDFVPAPAT